MLRVIPALLEKVQLAAGVIGRGLLGPRVGERRELLVNRGRVRVNLN
jgi:hypothetical protein